jgi:NAD-dependent deacetylase
MKSEPFSEAIRLLKQSKYTTAFTGAGISVESGIPPFRGSGGIWDKYDPGMLEISYFKANPKEAWVVIKEIFYDFFGKAEPNKAHRILAEMERKGLISVTITQNIDNLHQEAGCRKVYEFHGNSKRLICLACHKTYFLGEISIDHLPPDCRICGGLLKPDFVFFGEPIPQMALSASYEAAINSDVFLIIGTTGEVMPANQIPFMAKENGASIIEINPEPSHYTERITDLFLKGKAVEMMEKIGDLLFAPALDDDQNRVN